MVVALAGCGDKAGNQVSGAALPEQPNMEKVAEALKAMAPSHYYSMEDGGEYGYERELSQNDQESGTVTNSIVMFRYGGKHDDKYQVYTKDGDAVTAMECTNPCEFIKVLTFYEGEFIKKEIIKGTEGSIAYGAMMDAINGKMKPYVAGKQGKEYLLTFDEKRGIHKVPIDSAAP
jgi:hypothetical protein